MMIHFIIKIDKQVFFLLLLKLDYFDYILDPILSMSLHLHFPSKREKKEEEEEENLACQIGIID